MIEAGQRAIAMISYEDVASAADFLIEAFGFSEAGERVADQDGRVTHLELERGGATVMLGWPGPDYMDPGHHASMCAWASAWLATPWVTDGVLVTVEDVDAHHARAEASGAVILRAPEDAPPGRLYSAADPSGHRWMFLQPARR